MMLLSLDSSAVTASVALTDGDTVIKSEFVKSGLTHSETLMPMITRVMSGHSYDELDAVAVTAGPGSFTGVRIGVSTVKGIAFNNNIPCFSISTLEAIAYNFAGTDTVVCAVMDARRMQFYNALFKVDGSNVKRLCDDRAISLEDLREELRHYDRVVVVGDGAFVCCQGLGLDNCTIADDDRMYQNALGVAKATSDKIPMSAKALMPVYLRQSQAERELKLKK